MPLETHMCACARCDGYKVDGHAVRVFSCGYGHADPESLMLLESMGFSEKHAKRALKETGALGVGGGEEGGEGMHLVCVCTPPLCLIGLGVHTPGASRVQVVLWTVLRTGCSAVT